MNIIEKLKSLNVDITPEIEKAFDGEFISQIEHDKKIKKIETERDGFKERAETAEETLKGFEGKDFDAITKERDEWKVKYETKIREDAEAQEKAELDEAIANAIKEARGKNSNAIIANLDMSKIKASKNRDKDIADAIKALSEAEDTAFLFDGSPEDNKARFTDKMKGTGNGSKLSKSDIMSIKDRNERRQAMLDNRDLFPGLSE